MIQKLKLLIQDAKNSEGYFQIFQFVCKNKISINDLKKSEIFIDKRGTNRYKLCIYALKQYFYDRNDFQKYFTEVECFNLLFAEAAKLQNKIKDVPNKDIFNALFWGVKNNIKLLLSDRNKLACQNQRLDIYTNYDNVATVLIEAIKSLCYNTNIFKNDQFLFAFRSLSAKKIKKYFNIIDNYIDDALYTSYLEDYFQYWKNGIIVIDFTNETFNVKVIDKQKLLKLSYILIKQNIYNYIYQFPDIMSTESEGASKAKFAFKTSVKLLESYFSSKISNILLNNIPLIDWLNTYNVLIKFSEKYDYVYKTKKQWCHILINGNVTKVNAEKIFDKLVFNKKSSDIYDFPFINLKNKYLVCGSIIKNCLPAQCIISRVGRNDFNIDFKGSNFEKKFYNFCDDKNISYVRLHKRDNNRKEYECDAVIYIDNTLIFCELKNKNQYKRHEYEFEDINNDIAQINRIYDYYKNNLHFVKQEFFDKYKIVLNKKPHLKKLLIYSRAVDGCIKKDGVLCIDYLKFTAPFQPFIFDEYINVPSLMTLLSQKITAKNLFRIYEYPFYIFNYREKIELRNQNFRIGKYVVSGDMICTTEIINSDIERSLCNYYNILKLNQC